MKNYLVKHFNNLFVNFGFDGGFADFSHSMFTKQLLFLTIPISFIIAGMERAFGLKAMSLFALVFLLTFELASGLLASRHRDIPFSSRRFSRFGLKIFTWFSFLFIINSFKLQYEGSNVVIHELFDWLHSTIVVYVCMEYLISIDENISMITGGRKSSLATLIREQLNSFLKTKK